MILGTTPGLEASADSGMRGRDFRLGVSDCIGLLFVPSSDRLRFFALAGAGLGSRLWRLEFWTECGPQ